MGFPRNKQLDVIRPPISFGHINIMRDIRSHIQMRIICADAFNNFGLQIFPSIFYSRIYYEI